MVGVTFSMALGVAVGVSVGVAVGVTDTGGQSARWSFV